jgi:hypothetical protein
MANKKLGVSVELIENFLVIKETLERIGIRNKEEKKFFPSCYIVEDENKKDSYKIYHFKELFIKEGKESTYDEVDELRRNTIVFLLQNWKLIKPIDPIEDIQVKKVDVISHKEKHEYTICHKYIFKRKIDIID